MYTELTGIAALHQAMLTTRSSAGDLLNKVEYAMQTSIGKVMFRSNDMSSFKVSIGDNEYNAVLFFNPKFYTANGYPKLGEYVLVTHNNGQNAHIIFSVNPKNPKDPPLGGIQSKTIGRQASAKCSL